MVIGALEKTNLKSAKVRTFFILLVCLIGFYILGFVIYIFQEKDEMANMMFKISLKYLVVLVLVSVFFILLKWQILRIGILAIILLSLAHLFCAIIILVDLPSSLHALGLIGFGILFLALFINQSNLRVYFLDKTYLDVIIELFVAIVFICLIIQMIYIVLTHRQV